MPVLCVSLFLSLSFTTFTCACVRLVLATLFLARSKFRNNEHENIIKFRLSLHFPPPSPLRHMQLLIKPNLRLVCVRNIYLLKTLRVFFFFVSKNKFSTSKKCKLKKGGMRSRTGGNSNLELFYILNLNLGRRVGEKKESVVVSL